MAAGWEHHLVSRGRKGPPARKATPVASGRKALKAQQAGPVLWAPQDRLVSRDLRAMKVRPGLWVLVDL